MKNTTKKWLIAAGILIAVGLILFGGVLYMKQWDLSFLETEKFETHIHEIESDFRNLSFDTETADIVFAASDDGGCRVFCFEPENRSHSVSVKDGTLLVSSERKVGAVFGIHFHSPRITVYLPETEYASLVIRESTGDVEIPGDFRFESADLSAKTGAIEFSSSVSGLVKIRTTTGEIELEDMTAGEIDLAVSTGEVSLSGVTVSGDVNLGVTTGEAKVERVVCRNLFSTGSTGELYLEQVKATEKLTLKRTTGDVELRQTDAGEISVETTTGDVSGTLLSEKIFLAESTTGRINVPKTASGGRCEVRTTTGDIDLSLAK